MVTNIWNIKKRGTKMPLNIFYVELKPENNNKDIYEVTHVFSYTIKFEPSYPKDEIPQCINCQRCERLLQPKRGECASSVQEIIWLPTVYAISKNVKWMLQWHPANYKGCTVYKYLQKRHFSTLRKKWITTKPQPQVKSVVHTAGN